MADATLEHEDRRNKLDLPAPVAGGIRWRRRYRDIIDLCRGRGFAIHDPDEPSSGEPAPPEPGLLLAPRIVSIPPPEARVGREYVYRARACDGIADGFTWYFEKNAPGMTVDRHSGKVTWIPSEGGNVEVVICAASVYGASSRQSWTLCVRKAALSRPFKANMRFQNALRRKAARAGRPFLPVWRRPRRLYGMECQAADPPVNRRPAAVALRI